jgi:hypothetical protein
VKTIEITVDTQGQTRIETKGFTGSACREASKFVEQALGRTTAETLTSAFYQVQEARQSLQEGH